MSAGARLTRLPEVLRMALRRLSASGRPSYRALVAAARRHAPGPRLRRALAVLTLVAAVLCAGYFLWLRDLALVAVDEVVVSGATSRDASKIRASLVRAGRGMTTLHVDREALERAVSAFPEVRAIEADADFPSALRITVIERPPAAVLVSGEERLPVASDGTILTGLADPGPLPEVKLEQAPSEGRLGRGEPLALVQVLGAAPPALAPKLEAAGREPGRGFVVQLSEGPELVFGDTTLLEAKWAAAARVLADEAADGAEYIDLSIPERPAAGGLAVETLAPVVPAGDEVPVDAAAVTVDPIVPEAVPEVVPTEPQP